MTELTEIARSLRFPEGPIAMADGSVILVEINRGTLSRVRPDGTVDVIAETGGGPNGAAIGPDGRCYICNNGGFEWHEDGDGLRPILQAHDYTGGRIEAVDLETGAVEVLYTHAGDIQLRGPNDIVFDADGGFWFTDLGKKRTRDHDRGAVFYARVDGSHIAEAIFPCETPNGIGLSPDGGTLYVAETEPARVWAFAITGPGEIRAEPWPSPNGGRLLTGLGGYNRLDSLAVDSAGYVCVGTLIDGAITAISADGEDIETVAMPDRYPTNICFGGPGLRTAYVTLSLSGRLVSFEWPRPGLPLHFLNI